MGNIAPFIYLFIASSVLLSNLKKINQTNRYSCIKRENVRCKKANVRLSIIVVNSFPRASKEGIHRLRSFSNCYQNPGRMGAAVGRAAYLRDLLELVVGLAALLSCLQSDFIVIHKCFVHAKLAGLQGGDRDVGSGGWERDGERITERRNHPSS